MYRAALLSSHTSPFHQGWGGSRSEPGVFGSLEPEPELLEKNQVPVPEPLGNKGAGAAKKLAGSSALLEDKKHKKITSLRGIEYFAKLNQ